MELCDIRQNDPKVLTSMLESAIFIGLVEQKFNNFLISIKDFDENIIKYNSQ